VKKSYHPDRASPLLAQVTDIIRQRIVNVEYQPADLLIPAAIATELGTSETPVRQALIRLRQDGLTEIAPSGRTIVFQVRWAELTQLCEFRTTLECAAIELALRKGDKDLSQSLRNQIEAMRQAANRDDFLGYWANDDMFHRCLIEATENSFIISAYNSIGTRMQTLRNRLAIRQSQAEHSAQPQLIRRTLTEHIEIAGHIHRNRADCAISSLNAHLQFALAVYVDETVEGIRVAAALNSTKPIPRHA